MIKEAKNLKKCEVTFRRNQEILLISHQDKRLVNMISTLHKAEVIETTSKRTGVAKKKPKCVIDYNTHMHCVDTADQYLAYHPFIRKTVKWPKKVFFSLLQCCIFNGYVTFSKNNPSSRKSFLDYMSDITENRPPLWSSGQSFWLQIQRSRVRSPALPDFLSSIGSGTGSTQPREVN